MKIYLVGGAVRDNLLGLKVTDRDWLVTNANNEQMLALGYIQVGKDFPVFLHPKTKEEYALARTERKIATGYRGFSFTSNAVTVEQDLSRRDLTINAIAEDSYGNLIDPYNGQQDLKSRKLHAVSEAFIEDPVRILRIARFAAKLGAWDFKVTKQTNQMLKLMVTNGEVDSLVAERVWNETEKALTTSYPGRFIQVLRDCGALKVILPEIDRLFGVPQVKQHHPEVDAGIHTLMVLQQAVKLSTNPKVRFAALVHDLGKGTTNKDILPSHYGHEARSVKLVNNLCKRLKIPKDYQKLALLVAQYHGHFHRVADELKPKTIVKVLVALDAFRNPIQFKDFLLACEADQRGRTGFEHKKFRQTQFFNQAYQVANKIKAQTFINQGLIGIEIKNAICQARIKAISEFVVVNRN